jgi:hypothetical protein
MPAALNGFNKFAPARPIARTNPTNSPFPTPSLLSLHFCLPTLSCFASVPAPLPLHHTFLLTRACDAVFLKPPPCALEAPSPPAGQVDADPLAPPPSAKPGWLSSSLPEGGSRLFAMFQNLEESILATTAFSPVILRRVDYQALVLFSESVVS